MEDGPRDDDLPYSIAERIILLSEDGIEGRTKSAPAHHLQVEKEEVEGSVSFDLADELS